METCQGEFLGSVTAVCLSKSTRNSDQLVVAEQKLHDKHHE